MSKVSLCFICDENYVMPTVVAITSVIVNKNEKDYYDIYVVSNNLSHESMALLKNLETESARIIIVKTDNNNKYERFAVKNYYVTTTALYKLELTNLLPADLGKVLYLDGDIIAQKDVAPIFNEDIGNSYAGAVKDFYVELKYGDGFRQRLKVNHKGYFNTGVLLLNLKKLREDRITELLFQYRNDHKDEFMDQDTFNVVLKENVKYLPPFYNFILAFLSWDLKEIADYYKIGIANTKYEWVKDALIIHYAGLKPWQYFDFFAADIWFHYYLVSPVKDVPLTRKSLNEELITEKEKELTILRETVEKKEKELEELRPLREEVQKLRSDAIQLAAELMDVKTGWSFRIGRLLTWIPRKLLGKP